MILVLSPGEWGYKGCVSGSRIQAYRSERFSSTLSEAYVCEGVKFTWFCVTNFKSSITGSHVDSREHLFCTSGCISSINLKFSGLYPLIKLSLVSRQFLHKLNFKQVIVE